jgi:hypothetical protein
MAGIKIVDYASDRKNRADKAATAAQTNLVQTQGDLVTSQTTHDQAVQNFSDLQQAAAAIRRQLQAIAVPSDAVPLLAQLAQNMSQLRAAQEKLLDAGEDLYRKQKTVDRAQSELAAANALQATAAAGNDAAVKAEANRQHLRDAITQPPLVTMKADAAAAIAGPVYASANSRLRGGDLPSDLFDRALQRGDEAAAQVTAARQSAMDAAGVINEALQATMGQAGAVTATQSTFEHSRDAFQAYVYESKERFDRAIALLTPIHDSPALTADEKGSITTTDATLQADRDAALKQEAILAQKQADFDIAQAAVDKATWEAIRTSPDTDPSADAAVQAAVASLQGTPTTDLTKAQNDFTVAMQKTLDDWATAVPDTTWQLMADFYTANSILQDLSTTDPTALLNSMNNDELPYGQALSDQAQAGRAMVLLSDSAQDRSDASAAVERTEAATIASAVRGTV